MINNSKFTERLKKIMEFHQLSAAAFADAVGVQRSSISHLLSGRNKPSLDFVLKVLAEFEDVDLYWLMNGKGHFPKKTNESSTTSPTAEHTQQAVQANETSQDKEIERIIIFYKDGTFEHYTK